MNHRTRVQEVNVEEFLDLAESGYNTMLEA
jgi:hypothetical protein